MKDGEVKCGSLDDLINVLPHPELCKPSFRSAFLLTYQSFTAPTYLLSRLISHFSLSDEEILAFIKQSHPFLENEDPFDPEQRTRLHTVFSSSANPSATLPLLGHGNSKPPFRRTGHVRGQSISSLPLDANPWLFEGAKKKEKKGSFTEKKQEEKDQDYEDDTKSDPRMSYSATSDPLPKKKKQAIKKKSSEDECETTEEDVGEEEEDSEFESSDAEKQGREEEKEKRKGGTKPKFKRKQSAPAMSRKSAPLSYRPRTRSRSAVNEQIDENDKDKSKSPTSGREYPVSARGNLGSQGTSPHFVAEKGLFSFFSFFFFILSPFFCVLFGFCSELDF